MGKKYSTAQCCTDTWHAAAVLQSQGEDSFPSNAAAHIISAVHSAQWLTAPRLSLSLAACSLCSDTFHTPEEGQREAALSKWSKSLGLRGSDQYSLGDTSAGCPEST